MSDPFFPDIARCKKLEDVARILANIAKKMQVEILQAYGQENDKGLLHKIYLVMFADDTFDSHLPNFAHSLAQVLPCALFIVRVAIAGEFTPNRILKWVDNFGPLVSTFFHTILM